jgi:predicted benzoate:H+ symporter BenE
MKLNHRFAEWLGLGDDGSSRKTKLLSFAIVASPALVGAVVAGYWGLLAGMTVGTIFEVLWHLRKTD